MEITDLGRIPFNCKDKEERATIKVYRFILYLVPQDGVGRKFWWEG